MSGNHTRTELEIIKTVLDRLPVALFVKSGRTEDFGKFLVVNKMKEDILGLSAKEMLGKTDHELFPKEQADFFLRVDHDTFQKQDLMTIMEEPVDTPSGRVLLHTRKFPIYDKNGQPDYIVGISQDITAERRKTTALRQRERNMEIMLSTAQQLLAAETGWRDLMGRTVRQLGVANAMNCVWVQEIVEREDGGREARTPCYWNRIRPRHGVLGTIDLRSSYFLELTRSLEAGNLIEISRHNAGKEVRLFMKQNHVSSVLNAPILVRGNLRGAIGMAAPEADYDWSEGEREVLQTLASMLAAFFERTETQAELQLAETRLRHASKMEALGQLAGGIAHDFNNLLTSILGFSQLALDQLPEEHPASEDLRQVMTVGEQATQLSRQMLVLSRKHEVDVKPVDLCEAVRGFDRIFRRPLSANYELVTVVDEPSWIMANREQLELVVMNLAINARDAMLEGGTILVSARTKHLNEGSPILPEGCSPGRYGELLVQDDGPGIPDEIKRQVFEPFFTTKKAHRGTGLGLSTTVQVVEKYGGFLHLDSKVGLGSGFHLYFPICKAPAGENNATTISSTEEVGVESILVVEDEATLRNLTQRILEKLGYSVEVRSSGTEAYSYLLDERPSYDLILCDIVMPHMSGPEMVRRLEDEGVHYPVLFMSGYTANNIDQQGFQIDGCQLLPKPFSRMELAKKVREALTATPST